jgi:hypothetical protein
MTICTASTVPDTMPTPDTTSGKAGAHTKSSSPPRATPSCPTSTATSRPTTGSCIAYTTPRVDRRTRPERPHDPSPGSQQRREDLEESLRRAHGRTGQGPLPALARPGYYSSAALIWVVLLGSSFEG